MLPVGEGGAAEGRRQVIKILIDCVMAVVSVFALAAITAMAFWAWAQAVKAWRTRGASK